MSEARQRLERALARLEAALSRLPSDAAPAAEFKELRIRYDRLSEASRQAVSRLDRLIAGGGA